MTNQKLKNRIAELEKLANERLEGIYLLSAKLEFFMNKFCVNAMEFEAEFASLVPKTALLLEDETK